MKVIAINGSARKDGNTATMVRWVFAELEKNGIETELYQMKGKKISGCIACYKCFENKNQHCAVEKDVANECIDKMLAADGKMRKTDVADTEQLFRLIQSVPSPKAEPFKLWIAKVARERIDEIDGIGDHKSRFMLTTSNIPIYYMQHDESSTKLGVS